MDEIFSVNLNDMLSTGKYTVNELSDASLKILSNEVLKLNFFVDNINIDTYAKLSEMNECFRYLSMSEFKKIYELAR